MDNAINGITISYAVNPQNQLVVKLVMSIYTIVVMKMALTVMT